MPKRAIPSGTTADHRPRCLVSLLKTNGPGQEEPLKAALKGVVVIFNVQLKEPIAEHDAKVFGDLHRHTGILPRVSPSEKLKWRARCGL